MNTYVTGTTIKQLREKRNLTQAELAEKIGVSSKTVSKWETGRGLPDISLLQPLAQALGISVIELLNGEQIHITLPGYVKAVVIGADIALALAIELTAANGTKQIHIATLQLILYPIFHSSSNER